ncbi:GGDEF domain-containing protein [Aurantimonas sp. A2-1-M11]|uniref:GGDEF domain-containing protein n=1 Tax=Aurantimonas sp. A2-1-M11 TaxID=3113712 RepID=UPI002F92193E
MLRQTEPIDVYKALVSALADNLLPTTAIGVTFFGIGLYAYSETGVAAALAITIAGVVASVLKALFIFFHRRTLVHRPSTLAVIRRFEAGHTITTLGMAAPIGALCALLFSLPALSLHVVATALLFGYCAGVATRISVRPKIAMGAVILAAGPAIASAALFIEDARLLTGAVFVLFLVSAMETITHLHRSACRLITMRLQMAKLARLDPLTALSNRLGLREAFDELPRDTGRSVAIHAFDLDGFKAVNDQFGHATGDRLLQALAERLRRLVGEDDVVARVGGDEFVVLQPGLDDKADPGLLAQRIHRQLTEPCDVGTDRPLRVGLRLGYSIAPAGTASLDTLLRDADATSYKVKRNGGGFRPHRSPRAPSVLPDSDLAPRKAIAAA